MTGYNMPDGVNERDIPGNNPYGTCADCGEDFPADLMQECRVCNSYLCGDCLEYHKEELHIKEYQDEEDEEETTD